MGRAIHGRFTIMLHSPTSSNYWKGTCNVYGFALSEAPAGVEADDVPPCLRKRTGGGVDWAHTIHSH